MFGDSGHGCFFTSVFLNQVNGLFETVFINLELRFSEIMDKKQFLASGLLQQYVLGLTSPEETNLVEHFISLYPDIRKEANDLQQAMEDYAKQYAIMPPRRLKNKILSEISPKKQNKWQLPRLSAIQLPPLVVYSLFIIATFGLVYSLWNQQRLSSEVSKYRTQYEGLLQQQGSMEQWIGFIQHEKTHVIHLQGTPIANGAHAVAYWNEIAQKACVNLVEMPAIPEDKQYQIWADVHGEMINLGLLTAQKKQFQDILFIKDANSLNITLEPKGGSQHPTVNLLMVNGHI